VDVDGRYPEAERGEDDDDSKRWSGNFIIIKSMELNITHLSRWKNNEWLLIKEKYDGQR